MQVLAIYSDDKKGFLVRLSAFTGKVLEQEALRSPVTHFEEVSNVTGTATGFVCAFIKPQFREEIEVFWYPTQAKPASRPVHLWAADKDTGMDCDRHAWPKFACACCQKVLVVYPCSCIHM
jgi:hypothetical protein